MVLLLRDLRPYILIKTRDLEERDKMDMPQNPFGISLRDVYLFKPCSY